MFLSCLMINVGTNPDRPRPGRTWLRNVYHVHQRLCMAFPSNQQKERDPQFLLPYQPCGFPDPRPERCIIENGPNAHSRMCSVVGVERPLPGKRDAEHNFLFRIDPLAGGSVAILVQSAIEPDWDYAFQNARHLLAAAPMFLRYPTIRDGDKLKFRIRVNPTKKSRKAEMRIPSPSEKRDKFGRPKDQGKRVPLTWSMEEKQKPDDVIKPWFADKAWVTTNKETDRTQAFQLDSCTVQHLSWVVGFKPKPQGTEGNVRKEEDSFRKIKLRSALLEGILTVTHTEAFWQVVESGIGPAKAFGFGLLSIAPIREDNHAAERSASPPQVP